MQRYIRAYAFVSCHLEREQLAIQIQQELAKVVGPRGVHGVGLPPQLTEAIEQKQKAVRRLSVCNSS